MRSDHLSKHIKTHQKGIKILPSLNTDTTELNNLDDIILTAEADQSDLNNVSQNPEMAIGIDEEFDTDDESGSELSDSEMAATVVNVGAVAAQQK